MIAQEHHKKLTNGVGKCSVPMWTADGTPNGFCDKSAYGEPTREGQIKYSGYVPFLACEKHGGPRASPNEADQLDENELADVEREAGAP